MNIGSTTFFRRFKIRIILRLFTIGLLGVGTYILYNQLGNIIWVVVGGLLLTSQIIGLFSSINRLTRDLTSFLEAIQYSDFTQNFKSPYSDTNISSLYDAFDNVMRAFRKTRGESEAQRRYFETLVHHVGIGLLCYHPSGEVVLFNNAAKRLLDKPALLDIHDLEQISPELTSILLETGTGEHHLVQVHVGLESLQLSLFSTYFTLHNEEFVLVTLQNIGSQLVDSEMEAMQQMTRVLAHEILNSITPIVSLASVAQDNLAEQMALVPDSYDQENAEDLREALKTIEKRSEGLMHFVNAYRSITRIPQPDARLIEAQELISRIVTLFDAQVLQEGIRLSHDVSPEQLSVHADPDLIEQVLINLIKNAIEAFTDQSDKQIKVTGTLDRQGRVLIQVTDNGPGIPSEVAENIFVPFFSTKASGSGIGLSFSRHIMRRHEGALLMQTEEGGPTTFTLRF